MSKMDIYKKNKDVKIRKSFFKNQKNRVMIWVCFLETKTRLHVAEYVFGFLIGVNRAMDITENSEF